MCVAAQYATKGVRVNSVLPGAIMTEALETMAERNGVPVEEQYAKLAKFHAMQRVGHADEVGYYVTLHLQGARGHARLGVAGGTLELQIVTTGATIVPIVEGDGSGRFA